MDREWIEKSKLMWQICIAMAGMLREQKAKGLHMKLCPKCRGSGQKTYGRLLGTTMQGSKNCPECGGGLWVVCAEWELKPIDKEAIDLVFRREKFMRHNAERGIALILCDNCSATIEPFAKYKWEREQVGGCSKCEGMGFISL